MQSIVSRLLDIGLSMDVLSTQVTYYSINVSLWLPVAVCGVFQRIEMISLVKPVKLVDRDASDGCSKRGAY